MRYSPPSYYSLALFASFLSVSLGSSPVVMDKSGLSYAGLRTSTSGQDYFLGIPFAQPPVGTLRFKPPVAWSRGSTKVINATRNGYSCVQSAKYTTDSVSEDCLTLNIWKPTNAPKPLPVMVWIYGGGFYAGGISLYPGGSLIERATKIGKPVIYVAMNYRLGIFGFPPGQAAADAGASNLGLKDQRLALEWIQKNIAYFGGDPDKVIIFGESAGAISAGYQAFYKGGNIGGAFRGMILESGSPASLSVLKPNDPVKEEAFSLIANATRCNTQESGIFECIRKAPFDVLNQANDDLMKLVPYYQAPGQAPTIFTATRAPGDDFFTDLPSKLLHAGKFAKVPFINGAQLDEGTLFVNGTSMNSEQDIINWATARFTGLDTGITNKTAVRELLKHYPDDPAAGSPYGTGNETFGQGAQYKRYASMLNDLLFQAPRRDHLRTATNFGVKSWSYMFTERPLNYVPLLGVQHGAEIPFVMQTVGTIDPNATSELLGFTHIIGDYWINFAYHLDPNPKSGAKRLNWPVYGKKAAALQLLASNVTAFEDSTRAQAVDFILSNPSLHT
ncbi:hypothetical protein FRC08_004014 [Ceratobasidium sp. 394]|nr:hypothetical protein FRC08_004014 [Ceratobasidium sp. 394]